MWEYPCIEIHTNSVIDVQKTPIGEIVEPVTLIQAKNFLKIDFTDDDDIITSLITESREWVENRCGISVIHYDCEAIIQVLNSQELPYGPVIGPITIANAAGNAVSITSYNLVGMDYPRFMGYGRFTINYRSGFDEVPQGVIGAMLNYIAFCYENRGDLIDESTNSFANQARQKCYPFKRTIGF
jgi:hypothetical protein